ncbi:MAG: hypothetical protein ACLQPH_21125 [Acidimicrobiales bacterium]
MALTVSACGGTAQTSSSKGTHPATVVVSIPTGWTSYAYGAALISAPRSWQVEHDTNCPDSQAPGSLLLGFPKVLEPCPMIPGTVNYVAVTRLPAGDSYRHPPYAPTPVVVNGLFVYEATSLPGSMVWAVPTLGIQVAGTGTQASEVMHTLRRA